MLKKHCWSGVSRRVETATWTQRLELARESLLADMEATVPLLQAHRCTEGSVLKPKMRLVDQLSTEGSMESDGPVRVCIEAHLSSDASVRCLHCVYMRLMH